MAGQDRLPVFPSRANQVLIKQRVLAAQRGENLLKRKRDAIDMKLRELRHEIQDRKDVADEILREAIFSFAKANFLNTDFNIMRVENSDQADAFVVKRTQKVVGITLPQLDLILRSDLSYPLTGLARGGGQVAHIRMYFQEVLKNLVSVASLDFALQVLTVASRQNNMRVNALNYVLIPRLQNTFTYIRNELEEFEREDFYRLKKSQTKQLKAKLAFSQLIKSKNATSSDHGSIGLGHPAADQLFDMDHFEKGAPKKNKRKTAREIILANLRKKQMELKMQKDKEMVSNKQKVNKKGKDGDEDEDIDKVMHKANKKEKDKDKKKEKEKDKDKDIDTDKKKDKDNDKKTKAKKATSRIDFVANDKKKVESANQTELEADQSTQTDDKIIKTLKH